MTSSAMSCGTVRKVFLLACGCFNPPTIMHLRMFELAKEHLESLKYRPHRVLGGVLSPAHDKYGKQGLVSGQHRGSMLQAAVESHPFIRVSQWELEQAEWTRTRRVLDSYQAMVDTYAAQGSERPDWIAPEIPHEDLTGASFYLLCGDDLVNSFSIPNLWSQADTLAIARDYGLVVLSRGESRPQEVVNGSDILFEHQENIHFVLSNMGTDISSTKIRQAQRRGRSIRYLAPNEVIEYIQKHQLYQA
eukprot:maker-scaffold425_size175135-snap-gene-0.44 protein:Tk05825 transcript:maker-scaffold425_size175135-snap-gene-0.44-mRNA-1 annotation:"nicotinamide mononucleotide adenylyltransferase 1"